jgi:hypothetical protein
VRKTAKKTLKKLKIKANNSERNPWILPVSYSTTNSDLLSVFNSPYDFLVTNLSFTLWEFVES